MTAIETLEVIDASQEGEEAKSYWEEEAERVLGSRHNFVIVFSPGNDGLSWLAELLDCPPTALPEKLFAIIQQSLDRLAPYEEFLGAVYLRSLIPASKLSPWNLQSQERHLRYLRFIRDILADAEAAKEIPRFGDFGAYAFGLLHLAMITHWLQDRSRGKEETLALLDRCLKMGTHFLKKGGWEW